MKKILLLSLFVFLFTACSNATPIATIQSVTETVAVPALIPATETETPTATPIPTETPLPSPSVDLQLPPGQWDVSSLSPDTQASLASMIANPSAATPEARVAYDDFVTRQWQLRLAESGVAGAENLQGNNLLRAIKEYASNNRIFEVTLPESLQELILKDEANLVGFHQESDGKYYGYGAFTSPTPTHESLLDWSRKWFPSINLNGKIITPLPGEALAVPYLRAIDGNNPLLFHRLGVDPNVSQGFIVTMKDGPMTRFGEGIIYYQNGKATQEDLCFKIHGSRFTIDPCAGGESISNTRFDLRNPNGDSVLTRRNWTRDVLLSLLQNSTGDIHLQAEPNLAKTIWEGGVYPAELITVTTEIDPTTISPTP